MHNNWKLWCGVSNYCFSKKFTQFSRFPFFLTDKLRSDFFSGGKDIRVELNLQDYSFWCVLNCIRNFYCSCCVLCMIEWFELESFSLLLRVEKKSYSVIRCFRHWFIFLLFFLYTSYEVYNLSKKYDNGTCRLHRRTNARRDWIEFFLWIHFKMSELSQKRSLQLKHWSNPNKKIHVNN